jgi:hypothetical protein
VGVLELFGLGVEAFGSEAACDIEDVAVGNEDAAQEHAPDPARTHVRVQVAGRDVPA